MKSVIAIASMSGLAILGACAEDSETKVISQSDSVIVLDRDDDLTALKTMWNGLQQAEQVRFCQVTSTGQGSEQMYAQISTTFVYERTAWNAFVQWAC